MSLPHAKLVLLSAAAMTAIWPPAEALARQKELQALVERARAPALLASATLDRLRHNA